MKLRDISRVVLLSEKLILVGACNMKLYGDDLYRLNDRVLDLEVQAIYIDSVDKDALVIEAVEV